MLRTFTSTTILTIFLASTGWAQDYKFEITPIFGYTFSEGFTIDPVFLDGERYDKINPTSGMSYGFMFGFFVNENMEVGFLYDRQNSMLEASGTTKTEFADLKVTNYHGVFIYNFADEDDAVRPFFLGGLGATQYSPGDVNGNNIDGNTKFSTTWGGGVRAYAGNNIGFQVMGRWTPTHIKDDPGGVWCSPWWPWACYQLVNPDYSNQLELSAGVTFRF